MRLLPYIREILSEVGIFAVAVAVADAVLLASGSEANIVLLVDGVLVLGGVSRVVVRYLRDRPFWKGIGAIARIDDLPESVTATDALAASRLLPHPEGAKGTSTFLAIENIVRDCSEEVAAARRDADEHREYVETWVHEVKTPIAAARLTAANHPGAGMSAVSVELDRIDAYVDQALYYARSSSVDRDYVIRETNLEALVNDAVKAHARTLIERGVRIAKGGLDERVFCDAKWMRFCLGQVIENAMKYPAVQDVGRVPEISFSARHEHEGFAEECVVLAVCDNGRGIPKQDLPRLFDKGFVGENGRAVDATRSTGIGLYLVKRLCDKMGLGIGVRSAVGLGTEVDFTFPMNRLHFLDDESRL